MSPSYPKNLKANYGLTIEDWQGMVEKQNKQCAICMKTTKLNVDHCHSTGLVRGLLCNSCNYLIAEKQDNASLFEMIGNRYLRASAYLKGSHSLQLG